MYVLNIFINTISWQALPSSDRRKCYDIIVCWNMLKLENFFMTLGDFKQRRDEEGFGHCMLYGYICNHWNQFHIMPQRKKKPILVLSNDQKIKNKSFERLKNMWKTVQDGYAVCPDTHMTLHSWYTFTQAATSTAAASCFLSCVTCCVSTQRKAVTCCFNSHSQLTHQYI